MSKNINAEVVKAAVANAVAAGDKFSEEWKAKYGKDVDFGTCGLANIEGLSGRKRKLKKLLEETEGVRVSSSWPSGYSISLPFTVHVPTQNIGYYEGRYKAGIEALRKELGNDDLHVNSWVD